MTSTELKKNRPVAIWLYIGAIMIIIQVLLGGITRLTGSGLSITEWQPILGTLPPMNEKAWIEAFDKYKEIEQYKQINSHFSLSDFKSIYFWEWLHRDWARLMGLVFIFPFIYFVVKKKINRSMIKPMIVLFLLGALQGLIGWIMVKSGINTENVYVSHIRLAIHFMAALVLLCYVVWFALKLTIAAEKIQHVPNLKKLNTALLVLIIIQLIYGAFMAGTHAANAALTWPDINGTYLPSQLFTEGSFLADITHNLITIQFIHRNLAYIIAILVFVWWVKSKNIPKASPLYAIRHLPLILILIQVFLGVLTLLNSLGDSLLVLGVLHQFFGMMILLVFVIILFFNRKTGLIKQNAI